MVGWMRRVRRWLQRVMGRSPQPAFGADPQSLPAGPPRVTVVDCTGRDRGLTLCAALRETGVECLLSWRLHEAQALLLLLPIRTTSRRPAALSDLAGDLSTLLRSRPNAAARCPVVVAWYVEEVIRWELAVPQTEPDGMWNGSALLVGAAWDLELITHGGDDGAAALCRSARLRRLLDAPNHQAVGGSEPAALHVDAEALDPDLLIALCVQVTSAAKGAEKAQWAGEAGVVAAVRQRLTIGAARPARPR